MNTRPILDAARRLPLGVGRFAFVPNSYDLIALVLIIGTFVAISHGFHEMRAPLSDLERAPVRLDLPLLPDYALRTTLRMLAAMAASLVFTFIVATLAAKSRKAELVIVPALDILQSVPVLGFLTFTVVFFLGLFPGRQLGAECAAIFAVFTRQAWNMAFSFYQSVRTLPRDLEEASRHFQLSSWLRFIRLEAPFAMPGLVWNAMMSMSGGWFFVVASEAISVGDNKIILPGIGAWLALAIEQKNLTAIAWAVLAIAMVIVIYDQLAFRPIVAWADKFRFEQTAAQRRPRSWLYDLERRTRLVKWLFAPLSWFSERIVQARWPRGAIAPRAGSEPKISNRAMNTIWISLVLVAAIYSFWLIIDYASTTLRPGDLLTAVKLGLVTLLRVVVLIALASLVWVPIGVWIGLRPSVAERIQPLTQFLAAFPANVLFPFAVLIVTWGLNANIWLSPLMVLGTQWYILFNVIAGASAFPTDLREAVMMLGSAAGSDGERSSCPVSFPITSPGRSPPLEVPGTPALLPK